MRYFIVAVINAFVNDLIVQPAVLRHIIHNMLTATCTRRLIIRKLEEFTRKVDLIIFCTIDRNNDAVKFVIGQFPGFEFVQDQ